MQHRINKIANKISNDVISAVILPDDNAFRKYLEDHPDYREDTEFIVNGTKRQAPKKDDNSRYKEFSPEYEIYFKKDAFKNKNYIELHQLAFHKNRLIRERVAEMPNTRPETLDKLSNDESVDVRIKVAENKKTSPETLDKLSNDEYPKIRGSVARHKKTSSETLDKLSNDEYVSVRREVAENKKTSPETLDKLSNDEEYTVRVRVASNPNTKPEILNKLSKDEINWVRKSVASNPNTPSETLDELSDEGYYKEVSDNPSTKPETLHKLFEDYDEENEYISFEEDYTWEHGMRHINPVYDIDPDEEELMRIYNDEILPDSWIGNLAYNPNTPPEDLTILAESEWETIRRYVAYNQSTPVEILEKLSKDENEYVRAAVSENPNFKK